MWHVGTLPDDPETSPYEPAPYQVEADITQVQLRHNRNYVQLSMKVCEARRETRYSFFGFTLQTGRKEATEVLVATYRTDRDGVLLIRDARGRDKKCSGLRGFKINWDTNTVAVTIPRTCVGRPSVLRMKAHSGAELATDDYYHDDALSDRYSSPAWTPWVRRG